MPRTNSLVPRIVRLKVIYSLWLPICMRIGKVSWVILADKSGSPSIPRACLGFSFTLVGRLCFLTKAESMRLAWAPGSKSAEDGMECEPARRVRGIRMSCSSLTVESSKASVVSCFSARFSDIIVFPAVRSGCISWGWDASFRGFCRNTPTLLSNCKFAPLSLKIAEIL